MQAWLEDYPKAVERLRGSLAAGPPGLEGQLHMAPSRRRQWRPGFIPDDAREGAGLLLLYPHDCRPHVVLTVRDAGLTKHAGQVSLPGGAVDPGESRRQAALREAHEEIDVEPDSVDVLAPLSPIHIPISGFAVHPILGRVERRPEFVPRPGEVARILEVPLAALADPTCQRTETRDFQGESYDVPYFLIDGERCWGATAMILSEFLVALGATPQPYPPVREREYE